MTNATFPAAFRWGAATASYQVEGAHDADGKGEGIWDRFCRQPGRIANDDRGDVGPDHYHRWPEDIAFMRWLGLRAYRFSVAWPRVVPTADGRVNEAGLAFYDRLVDGLLAAGIEPWVTLFHWDLPQWCDDAHGGWLGRDTALRFGEYCGHVVRRLGDRVRHWFTMNEMWNFTDGAYLWGHMAPGRKVSAAEMAVVRHNALLAHGLAVRAIRAHTRVPAKVGYAEAFHPAVPLIGTPEHIAAAEAHTRGQMILSAILAGRYPERYLQANAAALPATLDDDLRCISAPLDLLGANSYTPRYVVADPGPSGYREVKPAEGHPKMGIAWLDLEPQVLYWAPRLLASVWKVPEIVISESGCCPGDRKDHEGRIEDTARIMFLRASLTALARAVAEGYPVTGYFHWSLLDNFEWHEGFQRRFGLGYVDYATQERTPKASAHWYRATIAAGAVC